MDKRFPDGGRERPPFLKQRMGYCTKGGFIGCMTILAILLAGFLLLLYSAGPIDVP
jgi:hypothetical protein